VVGLEKSKGVASSTRKSTVSGSGVVKQGGGGSQGTAGPTSTSKGVARRIGKDVGVWWLAWEVVIGVWYGVL